MMNLNEVVANFMAQPNRLGERIRTAMAYREAAGRGEISADELAALMEDLQRLDDIQLAADELDQKIAFDQCFNALKSIPLP
jgi:hypothetical protein